MEQQQIETKIRMTKDMAKTRKAIHAKWLKAIDSMSWEQTTLSLSYPRNWKPERGYQIGDHTSFGVVEKLSYVDPNKTLVHLDRDVPRELKYGMQSIFINYIPFNYSRLLRLLEILEKEPRNPSRKIARRDFAKFWECTQQEAENFLNDREFVISTQEKLHKLIHNLKISKLANKYGL